MASIETTRKRRGIASLRSAPQPYCQVCFGPETRLQLVRDRHSKRKMSVLVCLRCGYVELPENLDPTGGPDRSRRGPVCVRREREMSKLGMEVLDRSEVSVLKIGEHPELISSESVEAPRYDVVVAADVIDRFEDPLVEFAKLFSLVEDDGVLICSSTIYDGGPLASRRHIFGGGRGSYYTPQSLRRIAAAHKFRVDFRLPSPSSKSGARRRYVIFSGSPEVMEHVGDYFARHQFPPTRSRAAKRSRSRRAAVPGDTRPSVLA